MLKLTIIRIKKFLNRTNTSSKNMLQQRNWVFDSAVVHRQMTHCTTSSSLLALLLFFNDLAPSAGDGLETNPLADICAGTPIFLST
jgi:hypothetical protein